MLKMIKKRNKKIWAAIFIGLMFFLIPISTMTVNAWDDEPYAYDGNTATKAGCEITEFGWTWTPYIQLTLPTPIHINKIRFWAWYDSDHCDEIDIDVFWQSTPGVGGYWTNVYEGSYEDREWVEKPFQYSGYVTKARIRFEVQRWLLWPVVADLHEFKFYHVI